MKMESIIAVKCMKMNAFSLNNATIKSKYRINMLALDEMLGS
jgi:hypothetical protein